MFNFISIKEYAKKVGRHPSHVGKLVRAGKIAGVRRVDNQWLIPMDAIYPDDARVKSGKYRGFYEKYKKQNKNKDDEK